MVSIPHVRHFTSLGLCICLLAPSEATLFAADSRYPVIVTPGSPSIWSMEQAHYLLNRLRANNDSLKTRAPAETQLDPNDVNGIRMSALQTQLKIAASYEQQIAVENQLALSDYQTGVTRRDDARQQQAQLHDRLSADQLLLADAKGQKARLEALKAGRPADAPFDPQLAVDLAESTGKVTALEERVKAEKEQLASISTTLATPSLKQPTIPEIDATPKGRLLEAATTDLLKKTTDSFSSPKMSASIVLRNFLQMQYEIVSAQLTSLRDEAGKGQRVIFLEMPTSINSADRRILGKGGEDKLAQAWWRIKQIERRYKVEESPCWASPEGAERFYSLVGRLDGSEGSVVSVAPSAKENSPSSNQMSATDRIKVLNTAASAIRNSIVSTQQEMPEIKKSLEAVKKLFPIQSPTPEKNPSLTSQEAPGPLELRKETLDRLRGRSDDLHSKLKSIRERLDKVTAILQEIDGKAPTQAFEATGTTVSPKPEVKGPGELTKALAQVSLDAKKLEKSASDLATQLGRVNTTKQEHSKMF